jgi:hypothetical protein
MAMMAQQVRKDPKDLLVRKEPLVNKAQQVQMERGSLSSGA